MLVGALTLLALAACQTTGGGLGSAPQPVDLAKVSGTYHFDWKWLGGTGYGTGTDHYTVEPDGTTVVRGSRVGNMIAGDSHTLSGTIDPVTGAISLTEEGAPSVRFTGYVREQNGTVTIDATIAVGDGLVKYQAKRSG